MKGSTFDTSKKLGKRRKNRSKKLREETDASLVSGLRIVSVASSKLNSTNFKSFFLDAF